MWYYLFKKLRRGCTRAKYRRSSEQTTTKASFPEQIDQGSTMTIDAISDLISLCSHSIMDPLSPSQVTTYLCKAPFISLPGGMNLRSLTSHTLPPGRIYRSGTLTQIPAPMLSQLLTIYNIRTIYDLRRAAERETAPSPIIDGVEAVWIPSTDDGTVYWPDQRGLQRKKEVPRGGVPTAAFADGDGVEAWKATYRNILDTHGHIFKAVFEKIRDGGEGAVLFHCTGSCFFNSNFTQLSFILPIFTSFQISRMIELLFQRGAFDLIPSCSWERSHRRPRSPTTRPL